MDGPEGAADVARVPAAPAARPCGACPYRCDAPSGVWAADEYAKLPAYDRPTGEQPPEVFGCHEQTGRMCAGWVGCHDMEHNLALRIGQALGHISAEDADTARSYTSPVPLFGSGAEAAAHGLARIADPDPRARRTVDRLTRKFGTARTEDLPADATSRPGGS